MSSKSLPPKAVVGTVVLLSCASLALAHVQEGSDETEWDVTKAWGNHYEIDFETDEGTFTSVDVAPDGNDPWRCRAGVSTVEGSRARGTSRQMAGSVVPFADPSGLSAR